MARLTFDALLYKNNIRLTFRPEPCRPATGLHNVQNKLRRSAAACITASAASSLPALLQLGGKVTKSAIAKLPVAELRTQCEAAGLSAEGTKPILVERLLEWAQTHQERQDNKDAQPAIATPATSEVPASVPVQATPTTPQQPLIDEAAPSNGHASAPQRPPVVKVTWLGTSSGAPTSRRNVSSIAVRYGNDRIFLVDCGEGTRNQMRLAGINPALVTHIFITHLHGDHCFGIPGTIAAISAARAGTSFENEPIEVYGPPELHRLLLAAYRAAQQAITTPVVLRTWVLDPARAAPLATAPVGDGKLVMGFQAPDQASKLPPRLAQQWQADYDAGSDDVVQPGLTWTTTLPGGIVVRAAQLQHRMPCWGYVFQEPALPATAEDVREARAKGAGSGSGASSSDEGESGGEDWGDDGVGGEFVHPGRKLVILGDTCDSRAIAPIAYGCDLLSHEATYSKGMEEKASIATHSTAEQAGEFARAIKARNLVLTHFSARYEQIDKFGKVWTAAKERGMSVGELQASVTSGLQEEAKMAAGKARVYLANDFYTFTVAPRAPVPVGQLEHAAQSQQKGREDDGVWRPGVRPVALASRQQMAYPAQRGAGYSGQQGSGQPMPRHMDRGQQGGYSGHRGRGAYAGSRGGRRPDK